MNPDDEPVSSARVAVIVGAQILYLLRGMVLILALPFALVIGLISAIGIYTFTRPAEHLLAEILLPASIILFLITIVSAFYRQLRTPSAMLAVAMATLLGIVESASSAGAG